MQLELFPYYGLEDCCIKVDELFQAYFDCRSNKRRTANAMAFEVDYESKLIQCITLLRNMKEYPMEEEAKQKSAGLVGPVIFLLVIVALIYAYIEYGGISFNDPLVRAVQLSSPPGETVRFEKAFRNFFADGTWESILATDGNNYVNFSGKAFYGDTIEVFDLQFFIGEEKGVDFWKLSAIEVSGEPKHPGLFGNDLLEKIYEEYK